MKKHETLLKSSRAGDTHSLELLGKEVSRLVGSSSLLGRELERGFEQKLFRFSTNLGKGETPSPALPIGEGAGFKAKPLNETNISPLNFHFLRERIAFTLAEVLITLGIIGVVAAITMPTLIQNYKKHVIENRLKAAYSIFYQAVNSAKTEHGEISNWDTGLSNVDFVNKYILPYLQDTLKITEGRRPPAWSVYLFWNNVGTPIDPIYILPNGIAFQVAHNNGISTHQILLNVDLNGEKGPNTVGIDVFVFIIDPKLNKFQPYPNFDKWGGHTSGWCSKDNTWTYYKNMACAELIMRNSWKIPKDYHLDLKKWR